ncbi:MAG: ArsR/SmtB family transcription factor [Streptosporangiaceae bacterium]
MSAAQPYPEPPSSRRRPATEAEARALASATRLRILRVCLGQALTNKEIAERLGRNPGSVLHHVRRLVETGFLAAEPERPGPRGSREVPYRATGKSWTLDVHDRRPAHQAMLDAFLEEVQGADAGETILARLGVRFSDAEREEFLERVQAILDEYADRPSTVGGTPYSVFFAFHRDRR